MNSADDFVEHAFPIVVKKGGMFKKSGYTEASVEIANTGLAPVAVVY